MKLNQADREALWEFLRCPRTDEATVAAQVYPQAVLGPAVAQPVIVKRVWPMGGEERRKRRRKGVAMESLFPRSSSSG